jgi:hypothetical protein
VGRFQFKEAGKGLFNVRASLIAKVKDDDTESPAFLTVVLLAESTIEGDNDALLLERALDHLIVGRRARENVSQMYDVESERLSEQRAGRRGQVGIEKKARHIGRGRVVLSSRSTRSAA